MIHISKISFLFFFLFFMMYTGQVHAQTNGWGDGVNLQPSYYNNGDVNLGWNLMNQQSKIQTVRIEIEPDEGVPISTVKRWISEASNNGKNIICTYHNYQYNGSDNVGELQNAANWWKQNYSNLASAGSFTINLMNEWGSHSQTPSSFSSAYNSAISTVRQVYSGPIIVDIPGWGQETQCAKEASDMINDNNIVYSVHIYGSAYVQYGPNRWMTNADLDVLAEVDRPIIIGEFGSLRSGGADWSALVDHARSKGWTLIGWAWNGDGEGMNMVTPTWSQNAGATSFSESNYFSDVYDKLRNVSSSNLSVSTSSLSFSSSSGNNTFSITSDVNWSVSDNQGWISVSPGSGSDNGTVTVSVNSNTGASNRSGAVTVTGGGITRTVSITQNAAGNGDGDASNIALNKPTTASSTEAGNNTASNVADGNSNTRWSSTYNDPQWIYIDLQDTYTISQVVLQWEAAYANAYEIQVSDNASNWNTIYSTNTGNGGNDNLSVNGTGRYVRMYGTSRATQWGYSLWEFEIYGTLSDQTPIPPVPSVNYEAEDASFSSISVENGGNASGGQYASMQASGNITWTVNVASAGNYDLKIGYNVPFGTKTQTLSVNGGNSSNVVFDGNANSWQELSQSVSLNAGNNTITISASWGWMYFDYITITSGSSTNIASVQSKNISPASSIRAYPNPVVKELHITGGDANQDYIIYTWDGKKVYEGNNTVFDVEHLQPGRYILKKGKQTMLFLKE